MLIDEVIGPLVFDSQTMLSWPAQTGATMYEIVRSKYPIFVSGCWDSYTLLGHAAATMTGRYIHFQADSLRAMVDALDGILDGHLHGHLEASPAASC